MGLDLSAFQLKGEAGAVGLISFLKLVANASDGVATRLSRLSSRAPGSRRYYLVVGNAYRCQRLCFREPIR